MCASPACTSLFLALAGPFPPRRHPSSASSESEAFHSKHPRAPAHSNQNPPHPQSIAPALLLSHFLHFWHQVWHQVSKVWHQVSTGVGCTSNAYSCRGMLKAPHAQVPSLTESWRAHATPICIQLPLNAESVCRKLACNACVQCLKLCLAPLTPAQTADSLFISWPDSLATEKNRKAAAAEIRLQGLSALSPPLPSSLPLPPRHPSRR